MGAELWIRILLSMTAWIVLLVLTVAFTLAVRHGRPNEPPLPPGYDGERQLDELRARGATCPYVGQP
jgi:hypothetical protein